MTTTKNKTIFIIDAFTGNVLTSMTISENSNIPFSFICEFNTLTKKHDSAVVAKQWIEGDDKATIILR